MLQRQVLPNTSQGHKVQANPTFDIGTKYNSPNYKSTTSYDCHTKNGLQLPPPLLTLPTQHASATHPAPSPTHYHTQTPMQYLTTHETTVPLYCTLIPNTQCYPLYNQLILNSYSIPSSASHICTCTPNILSFSRHCHPTSIPHLNTQNGYQRMTQGSQLRMTIIFLYGN